MQGGNLDDKDIIRIALAGIFGSSTTGFFQASGFLSNLAENLGNSMSAAYLTLMIVTGFVLLRWW